MGTYIILRIQHSIVPRLGTTTIWHIKNIFYSAFVCVNLGTTPVGYIFNKEFWYFAKLVQLKYLKKEFT